MSAIDYGRMARVYPSQKAALTRAINSKDPQKVLKACRDAVREWNAIGAWPDAWHRWNIALGDARWLPGGENLPASLEDL